MQKIDIRQENVLKFMTKVLSNVEKEKFEIKKINFYSPMYTLFGDNWYLDTAFIIGNDKYMKDFKNSDIDIFGPYDDENDPGAMAAQNVSRNLKYEIEDNGYKTIILKSTPHEKGYIFTKMIGDGYTEFPYLIKALDKVTKEKGIDGFSDNNLVNQIINDIYKKDFSYAYSKTRNKQLSLKIIKTLNTCLSKQR